jgi:hypothetical protein
MTYTMKHAEWQWLIAPDPDGKGCILKYKKPTEWFAARHFDTPEAAADAVANGATGQKDWDDLKREKPLPGLAAWLIDPSAGPLSIVTEALKATLLPPRAEPGKAS